MHGTCSQNMNTSAEVNPWQDIPFLRCALGFQRGAQVHDAGWQRQQLVWITLLGGATAIACYRCS